MSLIIEITVCDRGTMQLHHKGDTRLLVPLSGEVKRCIDELTDNARLDLGHECAVRKIKD